MKTPVIESNKGNKKVNSVPVNGGAKVDSKSDQPKVDNLPVSSEFNGKGKAETAFVCEHSDTGWTTDNKQKDLTKSKKRKNGTQY